MNTPKSSEEILNKAPENIDVNTSDLGQWYKVIDRPILNRLREYSHDEFKKMIYGDFEKEINILIIGKTMNHIHRIKSLDKDLHYLIMSKGVKIHYLPLNFGIDRIRGISFNSCFLLDTLDDIDFEILMTNSQLCWVWKNQKNGWFGKQYIHPFSIHNFIFFTDDKELKKYDISLLPNSL